MTRRLVGIIAFGFAAAFATAPASAQVNPGVLQSAAKTANVTGSVKSAAGQPVAGADVRITGQGVQLTTKTDAQGSFSFAAVAHGNYSIAVHSAVFGEANRPNVSIDRDVTLTIQFTAEAAQGLKTIAKVSTKGAGLNINVTPASIYSFSPRDDLFQGDASWFSVLPKIPGVALTGGTFGGFGVNYIPGSPFQPVVVSINGALPYETSTTLDGMPFVTRTFGYASPGGAADLGQFSMGSFDQADIVRGPGANSPSIVDSIGGALVLHAPSYVPASHFTLSESNDFYGGYQTNMLLQLHEGKISAEFGYNAYNSPGPQGYDAFFTSNNFGSAPYTVDGQPFYGCGGIYGKYYGNYLYGVHNCYLPAQKGSQLYNIACKGYVYCNNNGRFGLLYAGVPINSGWTQHGYSAGLAYRVSPAITAQFFYAGGQSSDAGGNGYLYPTAFLPGLAGTGYTGAIKPGFYLLNSAVPGDASDNNESEQLFEERITASWGRSVIRISALQNNSYFLNFTGNTLGPANGTYTLYGVGYFCSDPTCYAPGRKIVFNGTKAALTFPQFEFSNTKWANNRDFLISDGTQVGDRSYFNASFVQSYYNIPSGGASYSFGGVNLCPVIGGCFGTPNGISEITREWRLNAGSQISDKLSADFSWYWAMGSYHVTNPNDTHNPAWTYSDFNFPYNAPRLGLVWRSSPDIAIRGAIGGGFALPPLDTINGGNNTISCNPGAPYCTQNLRNASLQPEKSFAYDIGTDMRFHGNTVVSLDVYRTSLWGQFFDSSAFVSCPVSVCGGLPLLQSKQDNLLHTRYNGLNFSAQHIASRGVFWNAALGLNRSYVVGVTPDFYNSVPNVPCNFKTNAGCKNQYIVPGINFDGQGNGAQPYANGSAGIGYSFRPGRSISLSATYYGNNNPLYVPAFFAFNLGGTYAFNQNLSLSATYNNVFGIHDDKNEILLPSAGAPNITGAPFPLYPAPFSPRAIIFTVNVRT